MTTRTAIITGSSTGIGRSAVKYFQSQGWNVVATMRSPEKEMELNQLDRVLVTRLDVTDEASITTAVSEGIAGFGKLDVLVNNAGYGSFGILEAASMDEIRRQFDTNVIGVLAAMKAVLPHFRQNHSGVIVNVGSVVGQLAMPLSALYNGTKFAIEGLSEALSYELAAIGVRIKIVEPGPIKTDFGGRSMHFVHDEKIEEYAHIHQRVQEAFAPMIENADSAEVVAQIIHEAAIDESERLRYAAGQGSEDLINLRKDNNDNELRERIYGLFSL